MTFVEKTFDLATGSHLEGFVVRGCFLGDAAKQLTFMRDASAPGFLFASMLGDDPSGK